MEQTSSQKEQMDIITEPQSIVEPYMKVPPNNRKLTFVHDLNLKTLYTPENIDFGFLVKQLKIPKEIVFDILPKPKEELTLSALIDGELIAQCFASDFSPYFEELTENLKKFENDDRKNVRDYVTIEKKKLELVSTLQNELPEKDINSVAVVCGTIIKPNEFVNNIKLTFIKGGCELLNKVGYKLVIIIAEENMLTKFMINYFGFTVYDSFAYNDELGLNIDNCCSILYKEF